MFNSLTIDELLVLRRAVVAELHKTKKATTSFPPECIPRLFFELEILQKLFNQIIKTMEER